MKIFREMLFLEGYSNQPRELLDACEHGADASRSPPESTGQTLLKTLWLLGGRPMHRGHNFDFDEETDYTALPSRAATAPACQCDC